MKHFKLGVTSIVAVAVAVLALPKTSHASVIEVSSSYETAKAGGTSVGDTTTVSPYSEYPYSETTSASQGSNTAAATLTLKPQVAGVDVFHYCIDLLVGSGTDYNGWSQMNGHTQFEVDTPTTYSLDGTFTLTGKMQIDQEVEFSKSGVTLFKNTQSSWTTLDESFVLGQQGGDKSNSLDGSTTGTLTPGTYTLNHNYKLVDRNGASDNQGTAAGSFTLTLTPIASTVPEPATFTIWGLIGAAVSFGVWHRKRRR